MTDETLLNLAIDKLTTAELKIRALEQKNSDMIRYIAELEYKNEMLLKDIEDDREQQDAINEKKIKEYEQLLQDTFNTNKNKRLN